jgi:hypothetical protein
VAGRDRRAADAGPPRHSGRRPDAASVFAESLGARQAELQPQPRVRVMIDPVGHIFDLFVDGS